jgi:hypothetical protein
MSLGLDVGLPNAADRATVVLDGETVELAVARA